ncbi:MAG: ABC transporter permease [Steroidobacteraceae bacterium]
MKFVPLIWAGIWRKRSRAILMLLQIASAFVLFGVLQGLDTGVSQTIAKQHGDRLYVSSSVAMGDPLPIGLLARIQSVPGVEYITPRADFGGSYQKLNQFVPVVAGDVDSFFKVYEELKTSPAAIRALKDDRSGAIVGIVTMRKYGWRIGDHIVLTSGLPMSNGSRDWGFDIVGSYNTPDEPTNATALITNFTYLNESRLTGRDHADMFITKIDSPADADRIGLAIDNAFANSSNETHTQSEAELAAAQLQQLGDLDFIVHGIIGAVFFAVLFATGALMMQALRERLPELAVLKTVGFTDRRVMALMLCESVAFCLVAAGIGLALSTLLLPLARQEIGFSRVPDIVFAEGAACAVVLALVSAWIPASRGSRLQVVDALAGR